jgi:hypothetical protein
MSEGDIMQKLPIGRQDFKLIRENNYLYVDKTKYIHKLIENGDIYFLSRPRRFGKSLLLSTIAELFKGNEKLFKELYIHNKWKWKETYIVIYIDLSNGEFKTVKESEKSLTDIINRNMKELEVPVYSKTLNGKFTDLIFETYKTTGKRVVVLIDEYDKAIIDNITDINIADKNRRILHDFYQIIKSNDQYIKFVFITGVSKFAQVSIFSGLNSPDDITFDKDYGGICGYTHEELEDYFKDYIEELAVEESLNYEEILQKINFWYDGYSWDGKIKLYNPFSTLLLFKKREFSNYWFKTGTPTFLMEILKKENNLTPILQPIIAIESDLDAFDIENSPHHITLSNWLLNN